MDKKDQKLEAVRIAMQQIEKQYGKGAIMKLGGKKAVEKIEVIPTGSIGLDIALGVGGIPKGRITEIYGPEASGKTSLALHIIAEAQKKGGTAAFIDVEHGLDPLWAKKIGVNLDDLLISQPDTAEQALEIAETLIRSGGVDVIVLDSVAALVPKAEIEGEMGEAMIGVQARLMSQAMRKLAGVINKSKTAMIFTNQIRMKIGVMFGCFHYDTRLVLADGATEKIGKIVNQKMDVEVLSYNQTTGDFEPRRITKWFDNGRTDIFLQFKVASNNGNGFHQFACTPNHLLLTEKGYRSAGEMQVGDRIITSVPYYLSPIHKQVVYGSILGDGSLRRVSDFNAQLRIGHGAKQTEYCLWKKSLFSGILSYQGTNAKEGHSLATIPMYELAELLKQNYKEDGHGRGHKDPSHELINNLTPLAIAIWYMDDGTFDSKRQNRCSICCAGFPVEKRRKLVQWFNQRGMTPTLNARSRIDFGVSDTRKLHEMIAPYVHPSMDYKLMPSMRGQFTPIETNPRHTLRPVPMPVVDIHEKPPSKKTHRFDIEVEDNHNFVVDGVVVHNSPETTPGGLALKFYSSIRLDTRRIGKIEDNKGNTIGSRHRVRVKKNKVAPPFRQAEFEIMSNENGISRTGELLDLGLEYEIVERSGSFYKLDDKALGQGREAVKAFLAETPKIAKKIEEKIWKRVEKTKKE